MVVSDRIMIRRNNSAEFSSGLHGGINFRFKNWFRQKCRNNTISAEITFIRPKWGYFGRNYSFCQTLPDLAYVSRLVRCVIQDGGRELIYLYGSHTSYFEMLVNLEIATAYLYCHVPRDEGDGGKFGGPGTWRPWMKPISANFLYISFRYLSKYDCRVTA